MKAIGTSSTFLASTSMQTWAVVLGLGSMTLGACDLQPPERQDDADRAAEMEDELPAPCAPGGTESDGDCVHCECLDDGTWACAVDGDCGVDDGSEDPGCSGGGSPGDPGPGDPGDPGDPTGPGGTECEPGDVGSPDGCNTCSCTEDGQWACTQLGCEDDGPSCTDEPSLPFQIVDAHIDGDQLVATVAYSGGCTEHQFDLCWSGLLLESYPPQTHVSITHLSEPDACEAYPQEEHHFDLSDLRGGSEGPGILVIHLDGFGSLEYTW